jgi:hypothetical protein
MEIPVHSRAATALLEIFESGRPLVYVRSAEEGRVADLLRNAGRQLLRLETVACLDLEPHGGLI